MSEPYKFRGSGGMIERGSDRYGTKANCETKECPQCFGGGRYGLLNCNVCNGTGSVANVVAKKEG